MYFWAKGKQSKLIEIATTDEEKKKIKQKKALFPFCL